jgi:hypothetical protein
MWLRWRSKSSQAKSTLAWLVTSWSGGTAVGTMGGDDVSRLHGNVEAFRSEVRQFLLHVGLGRQARRAARVVQLRSDEGPMAIVGVATTVGSAMVACRCCLLCTWLWCSQWAFGCGCASCRGVVAGVCGRAIVALVYGARKRS